MLGKISLMWDGNRSAHNDGERGHRGSGSALPSRPIKIGRLLGAIAIGIIVSIAVTVILGLWLGRDPSTTAGRVVFGWIAGIWVGYQFYRTLPRNWVSRLNMAAHPGASGDQLEELRYDRESAVRMQVVLNPNTTVATLKALVHDPDPSVAQEARRRLDER